MSLFFVYLERQDCVRVILYRQLFVCPFYDVSLVESGSNKRGNNIFRPRENIRSRTKKVRYNLTKNPSYLYHSRGIMFRLWQQKWLGLFPSAISASLERRIVFMIGLAFLFWPKSDFFDRALFEYSVNGTSPSYRISFRRLPLVVNKSMRHFSDCNIHAVWLLCDIYGQFWNKSWDKSSNETTERKKKMDINEIKKCTSRKWILKESYENESMRYLNAGAHLKEYLKSVVITNSWNNISISNGIWISAAKFI